MQEKIWEREYRNPKLVTKDHNPQPVLLNFFKYIRKNYNVDISNLNILDLGSGTGRNSNHLATLAKSVSGIEISDTAIELSKARAKELNLNNVSYIKQSFGLKYPFLDNTFDVAIDVTSSNSLTESERKIYLQETHRVLKTDGYFFVRALCKDGDKNAKNLIKQFPGKEYDTYVMPEIGLTERVFSKEDFVKLYSPFFEIIQMEKSTHYAHFMNKLYKRNYWIVYLRKI
jgi:ubiquinone/menaquinone biosynthesis C-methylase UbiE